MNTTAQPRILAFAGSTRKDSFNKRLIRVGVEGARSTGADVTLIDLADYPLPLYDGDLESEHGLPDHARTLKDLFLEHDGLLISAPEYNSSITGVLKNTIDWVSRPVEGEAPLECFDGKVAGLMAASPGGLGGLRGLVHLRAILGNIKVIVLPEQQAVARAGEAFNDNGDLIDDKQRDAVQAIGRRVAEVIARLNP